MTLRAEVLTSLRWTVLTRFFAQLVTWSITILVMRVLSPADYGLLAIATVFTGILELVNEIGLSSGIVQSASLRPQQLRQIFGAVLLANLAACLLTVVVLAPWVARFFGEPELAPVMKVLGVAFLPVAFTIIPAALLERDMQFRARSILDFTAMGAAGLLVLWLAYHGFGVWALVWGYCFQVLWRAVGLNLLRPYLHLPSFRFDRSDPLFRFGRDVFVARLLWFFYIRADAFIAGKLLGKEALGLYSVSMHIASLPLDRISLVVNQLALAAFSRAHRESSSVSYHVLKATRVMSFVAFPALWGIAGISRDLVALVLGKTWEPAAPLLGLLCLVMPMRMLGELMKSALQSVGHANTALNNTVLAAVVMPVAFYVGCQFDVIGLALAWLLVYPAVFLVNVAKSAPRLGLAFTEMLSAMAAPAWISGIMFGAVVLLGHAISGSPLQNLAILIITGALTYLGVSFIANRAGILETWDLIVSDSRRGQHA